MKYNISKLSLSLVAATAILFTSCKDDDTTETPAPVTSAPETYSFERNGETTVAYSGQEDRIAMLNAIGRELAEVNSGGSVDAQTLKDMFANENGAFSSEGYTKDLKSKCASSADQAFYEEQFDIIANISQAGQTASNGTAGFLAKEGSPQNGYLFDENGVEPRQIILKGLMGSVFYYRTVEDYLGVAITGDDNETIQEGKNYTQMEHHYDEAFGYVGIATDLTNSDTDPKDQTRVNFWGEYIVKRHIADDSYPMPGINEMMLDAFIDGRFAIVQKDYEARDAAIQRVVNMMERVCANNALSYLEDAKDDTDPSVKLHHLSEAIGFMIAMRGHIDGAASEAMFPRLSDQSMVDEALAIIGLNTNLWEVSNTDIDNAISKLEDAFGGNL